MQNDLFEKWYIENHPHSSLEKCEKGSYFRKKATLSLQSFQAGAQSKQDEIDELRKRIGEALTLIYAEKQAVECGKHKGVDADLIIGIGYELHLILKGTTNEQ